MTTMGFICQQIAHWTGYFVLVGGVIYGLATMGD